MSTLQTVVSPALREALEERDLAIQARDDAWRERDGVTVVIPCFAQANFLPICLASVFDQTVSPIEVLVIDDGNPDLATKQCVDQRKDAFAERGISLRNVRITNRGLASARNTGLMLARGIGYLPIDADDTIREDYIEKTWPLLKDHDVVLTGIQEVGARDGCYEPGFDLPWEQITEAHLWAMNRFYYCSLFRTSSLREVGGYNARMALGWEDYSLWLDYMRRGYRFNATREPLLIYRTTNDGMMARCARDHSEELMAEMRRHHLHR